MNAVIARLTRHWQFPPPKQAVAKTILPKTTTDIFPGMAIVKKYDDQDITLLEEIGAGLLFM